MDFSVYQKEATKTAAYPNAGNNILYPMLGLAGECGDVVGKISKIIRDDDGILTSDRKTRIGGELGDCLWYMAAICTEAKLDMNNLYLQAQRATRGVVRIDDRSRLALRIFQQIAHMSMLIERFVYGPFGGDLSTLLPLNTDITILFTNIIDMCLACSLDVEQIAQANLEKLTSRQERGVISGDGCGR